jgi:hypothetical protein
MADKDIDLENNMDLLTSIVVDSRSEGYTFEEIATENGISVEEVVRAWKDYIDSRTVMTPEEQWVLHLIRLEKLLVMAHKRADSMATAEDLELFLKIFDRIEALQALNKARKTEAQEALTELTKAQTQIILTAMVSLQRGMKELLAEAFEKNRTIKALKGEVLGNFDTTFLAEAQKALSATPEEQAA